MTNTEQRHTNYLNELIRPNNLITIDETPENITLILKEPDYYFCNQLNKHKCPDLFIKYLNDYWTVIELKGTFGKKSNAINQINSGIELLVNELYVPKELIKAKLVVYKKSGYEYLSIYD